MSLVDDYLQSFLAASLGERVALVALVLALAIVLRQVLRARQPDTPAPALAALGERLEMTTRRTDSVCANSINSSGPCAIQRSPNFPSIVRSAR